MKKWDERPKAFATLKDGGDTMEEVLEFCCECLEHFKCADAVECGELPKSTTEKVQKYELREKEWEEHGRRTG